MTPYTAVDLIRVVNSEMGERRQKGEQFQQATGFPRSARTEDERSRWQRVRTLLTIRHAEQNPKADGHA